MRKFFEVTFDREHKIGEFGSNHCILEAKNIKDCMDKLSSPKYIKNKNYNELSAIAIKEVFYIIPESEANNEQR